MTALLGPMWCKIGVVETMRKTKTTMPCAYQIANHGDSQNLRGFLYATVLLLAQIVYRFFRHNLFSS